MTKEELYKNLDEMSLPDRILDLLGAPCWRFWRRKAQLKEQEVLPLLREYLQCRDHNSHTQLRENAYCLFAKCLEQNFDSAHCQFLIDRLEAERDKNVLHTMLSGICRLRLPSDICIAPIAACSKSEKWLIRHSAIQALATSDTEASREAVRYWVRQADEKRYKYELIYGNAALGCIGTPDDIALLERHIHSRVRDVRDSAMYAVDSIRQRFGQTEKAEEKALKGVRL